MCSKCSSPNKSDTCKWEMHLKTIVNCSPNAGNVFACNVSQLLLCYVYTALQYVCVHVCTSANCTTLVSDGALL